MGLIINDKFDSIDYINKLGLNKFAEEVFRSDEKDAIKKYLVEHPVKYYLLKDKTKTHGQVYYALTKDEVMEHVDEYEILGIDISALNYIDHKLLTGEIKISHDNNIVIIASTNKESNHRNFLEPRYTYDTDLFDERIKYIPYIDEIINYIFEHHLFDVIVEFCLFDIPLGIKKEKVVIYEIRTEY